MTDSGTPSNPDASAGADGSVPPDPASILANLPDGIVTLDADLRLTYANPAARRLLGPDLDRLAATPILETCRQALAGLTGTAVASLTTSAGTPLDIRVARSAPGTLTLTLREPAPADNKDDVALALHESESRFRHMAETVADILFIADAAGNCTYVNDRFHQVTGLPRTIPLREAWTRAIHSDDFDRTLTTWLAASASAQSFQTDYRLRTADGDHRWFLVRCQPIRDGAGSVTEWYGTCTDIHAWKLAQLQLAQQADQLAAALRDRDHSLALLDAWIGASPVAFAFLDADLRYVRVNRAQADLDGIPMESHAGRTVRDVLPRQADTLEGTLRHVMQSGQPLVGMEYDVDPATHRPGVPSPAHRRHVMASFYPVRARDGSTLGVGMVNIDITDHRRVQHSLTESRRNLTLALEAAQLGYIHWDCRTNRLTCSQRTNELLGYAPPSGRPAEPTYDDWRPHVHPDDLPGLEADILSALRDRAALRGQYRVIQPDASVRWIEAVGQAEHDPAGNPLSLAGFVRDVTERVTVLQELSRSKRLFERIADASPGILFVYDLRRRANTYTNRSVRDVLGYDPAHLDSLDEIPWEQLVHPDDAAANDAARARYPSLADGEVLVHEYRLRHRDGNWRWLRNRCVVFARDDDGAPTQILGMAADVTDLKQVGESLRAQAQQIDLVQQAAQVGFWSLAADRSGGTWSEQCHRLYGTDPATFTPTFEAWLSLVHPDDRTAVDRAVRRTVQYNADLGIEFRLRHPNRGERWLFASGRMFADAPAGAAPARLAGIVLDLTDRKTHESQIKEARDAAEAASRAKDHFLAALSHELRTPLTPVVMTLAALDMNPELPPQAREDLQTIRRNIDMETRLIDDLLDVTRVAHGKLRLHTRPTHAHELVGVVAGICKADLDGRNIRLVQDLRAPTDLVSADPARFQQVLWNLIKNAIKFTPESGTITVRTYNAENKDERGRMKDEGRGGPASGSSFTLHPSSLVIEVTDTGIGIEPQALPRIFRAFEQADGSITRQFGGLGLGLTISKAIVELHGGTIRAASAGRHAGATFTVSLPVISAPSPRVLERLPSAAGAASREPGLRILLVEDHQETLRILRRLLELKGHSVVAAPTVAAAIDALRQHSFDILVSDIGLPDASGLDLMSHVRDHYRLPGIAMSGFGMESDLARSADAGFSAHLIKPIDPRNLESALRQVLLRKHAARA